MERKFEGEGKKKKEEKKRDRRAREINRTRDRVMKGEKLLSKDLSGYLLHFFPFFSRITGNSAAVNRARTQVRGKHSLCKPPLRGFQLALDSIQNVCALKN